MRRLSELLRPARRSLRTLGPADRDAALQWMAARPASSAFLLGWVQQFGMPSRGKNSFYEIFVDGEHGAWTSMALVVNGALMSAAAGDATHGETLAALLHDQGYTLQTVVGPDAMISAFVRSFCGPEFVPRVNQSQCIMQRERATPLTHLAFPPRLVRQAVDADAVAVIESSLAMHAEEVKRPNSQNDALALRRAAMQKIRTGRVWVHTDPQGTLLFKASRSLPTPEVVQVEGVWTAPEARGQGIAQDCLTQIFTTLHQTHRTISLTVGRQNTPAINLYRRLGMEQTLDWRTVYLDAPDEESTAGK